MTLWSSHDFCAASESLNMLSHTDRDNITITTSFWMEEILYQWPWCSSCCSGLLLCLWDCSISYLDRNLSICICVYMIIYVHICLCIPESKQRGPSMTRCSLSRFGESLDRLSCREMPSKMFLLQPGSNYTRLFGAMQKLNWIPHTAMFWISGGW